MKLSEILKALELIAPLGLAESWDNVGLLVGDASQEIRKIGLTIDYTQAVADELQKQGCDLVIAYHPLIFDGLKRVTAPGLIHDAVRRGVAIYSPHTAMDVAPGGTNDMLADALWMLDRKPLKGLTPASSRECKLVTFVPEKDAPAVAQALHTAGAGVIGDYSHCTFGTPGTGTFVGETGARPAVGQAGQLEHAAEIRLETIVPLSRLADAVAAIKRSHPYEEPAINAVSLVVPAGSGIALTIGESGLPAPLHPAASTAMGMGRIGRLDEISVSQLVDRIKKQLGLEHLLLAGPTDRKITRAACCAGACGKMLDDALAQGAQFYLTGEMRHHDALKAAARGLTVACLLHSNTERAVLTRLADAIEKQVSGVPIYISRNDRDPFEVV